MQEVNTDRAASAQALAVFFLLEQFLETPQNGKEEDVKRARRWILLTAAGIIVMLVGSRAQEAVVLDPDNMGAI